MLGKAVTLSDRGSLAGLLDAAQRDGLLSAVWLLMSDTRKQNVTRTLSLTPRPGGDTGRTAREQSDQRADRDHHDRRAAKSCGPGDLGIHFSGGAIQ